MKIQEIVTALEQLAPTAYQESYDNAGLITGNANDEVKGALICLDSTEAVIDEAIKLGVNLVIAHHPILFSPIKKLSGSSYPERTIVKAIKNDIAIYAIHTNLDNVTAGVNKEICDRLGVLNPTILSPVTGTLRKLVTYIPHAAAEQVKSALYAAGGGNIGNYDACSFNSEGTGTFRANEEADPTVGKKGEIHSEPELRVEMIYEARVEPLILKALHESHPYEEVAYQCVTINNKLQNVGNGMIGKLGSPEPVMDFLNRVKSTFKAGVVRYTAPHQPTVETIAVCGGSGSFLLQQAIKAGADVLVTADFKYHQFFDADNKIVIADIGHFESEQFTMDLLYRKLNNIFPKFALHLAQTVTNPVLYC